ncbi:MAG: MBL fold metallo-hydrolase [Thermogemmatispora sp.]|jgi:hydroxyacylglutathione hydrolase|uniref:MBL fold hydrolase n=1 Tax=Thermogemmatispora aurantia TaxID=2045279 RepID=A0A5J4KDY2_9CHLR|nr:MULTISPECIES: MBL fold metallo-hydrolase [Thermogemmatispora]MBE3565227.1 MBL fold metallo-hydrolase [Thermogemmatispora sp.]GER85172.1 MBL fold hydrolase [Thermogemmatispora aurantia]
MQIEQFFIEGLGHQSYFVSDGRSGQAAVVDPRRDVDVYLEAAARSQARITHILETHIHNDYVTGGRELAARTGATIVASADAHLLYPHQPVRDGDRFRVGELTFQALATPGHTPEHTSYLLYQAESSQPYALFSGGSMLVGSAGRTDLLGPELTLTLTRQQYHSLLRLLQMLPDSVLVYPTHGAGSFCVASAVGAKRSTTIGQERLANPVVQARDEVDFVRRQLASYTAYPHYYRYMHDINQQGPRILGGLPELPPRSPQEVQRWLQQGLPLVDGRPRTEFAREHIPGSLNIELDSSFATYVGWLLPFNTPLLLLIEDEEGRREAVVQLIRIGYEQAQGYLAGGIAAWKAAALPTGSFERIDIDTLYRRWKGQPSLTVLDVRRDDEWRQGHIPGALHLHIGDLPQHLESLPRHTPLAVICHSGHRASIAASMLAATGREVVAVDGGVPDWQERGLPLVTEPAEEPTLPTAEDLATHAHP